jgi:hypothetical protein
MPVFGLQVMVLLFSGKQLLMAMGYGTVDKDHFGIAGF